MRRILAVAVLVAVLGASSCGVDGGEEAAVDPTDRATTTTADPAEPSGTTEPTATEAEYVDALSEGFDEGAGFDMSSTCLAQGVLDELGVEALQDAMVSPDNVAEGGFLGNLDLDDAELDALGVAVGGLLLDCEISVEVFRSIVEAGIERDALTDADLACTAEVIAEPMGHSFVRWMGDGGTDMYAEGEKLAPIAVAGCPDFGVEVMAQAASEEGVDLNLEQRACLRDAFDLAWAEEDEITELVIARYAADCVDD